MPRIRSNLGRRTSHARQMATARNSESDEHRTQRNASVKQHNARTRSDSTEIEREIRRIEDRYRMKRNRALQNRSTQNNINLNTRIRRHTSVIADLHRAAFSYNVEIAYNTHASVIIGAMDQVCQYCKAFKFVNEAPGMCCANGKIKLPDLNSPPEPLRSLVSGTSSESNHFLRKIQTYNSCFQMTSFGATNIIRDNFMPTFKIQGQIYHKSGSLLPFTDSNYQFLQIYFIGNSTDEVDQRCAIGSDTRKEIIEQLQNLFHDYNELVQLFQTALDRMPSDNHKIIIRADKTPSGEHARRFNAPTIDDVAIVIVGEEFQSRDIVLHRRNEQLQRVAETHRCYDALQYPIMFPYGEDGYHFNIKMINPLTGAETNKKVSAMNYYAYRLMVRENKDNHILRCRKLFHQYAVDMYAKIETERLNFIRYNQTKLRCEEYIHLRDAINSDRNLNDIGKMIILPATYIGSPRHMHEYSQDAMTYVRSYGRPDLFITITCNPKWSEIKHHLFEGQLPTDRHDITARVFKLKLKTFMNFINVEKVFGEVRCWMYSVEWQKRGLPHAHILIWLIQKIRPDELDNVISAEIPDQSIDPELFEVVTKNMIHGPCGTMNINSPCMIDGKCSKRYPRALISETITGDDSYPLYRRRSREDSGKTAIVKIRNEDVEVDNRWIVPYSPLLSKIFKAHINVEYCNSVKSIKYICKYVNKGSDMAIFEVSDKNSIDEVSQYQMGRYISSNEAIWRILSFPIHERHPTVTHLAVHLENGQRVYFTDENVLQRAAEPPSTTLTSFFRLCEIDAFARTLLYSEVPHYYIWNQSSKAFQRRKQGKPVEGHLNLFSTDALGRIYTVHPSNAECFYLRLLLINIRGPTSFQNLRTINGELCSTYREACQRLHLLEDDSHWDATLADAFISAYPHQIRILFSIILSTCFPSNPMELWIKYRDSMTEDILHQVRHTLSNPDMQITSEMHNETLIIIEDLCLSISNKSLVQLGITPPNRPMHDIFNNELERELQFDCNNLSLFVQSNVPKLNELQKQTYSCIMQVVNDGSGGVFFLDAPGGTGKTFLISLILATVRSQNGIAVALASSGIAATLLDGGRTAHSALKLPLNMQVNDKPTCNITRTSGMAKVLQQCKIIIWDECTMAHKKSLEALDRTLQDLRRNKKVFGGAMVLLSGDFRQTLPIVPRSTAADELNACLKSSHLWKYVKHLKLTTNVRVQLQKDPSAEEFSRQLLEIGNGLMPIDSTGLITLPSNFCHIVNTKKELIDSVFLNIVENHKDHDWLSRRAILAGKNKDVNEINWTIQNDIVGELFTYKSVDTILKDDDTVNYPTEFLNSLDLPGLPPHNLQLKIGVPIIMLRNINQPRLCNGTRLVVKKLMSNIIEATILKGKYKGEDVLIPRIPMIPSDLPFDFKRLQFPVRLAFAMTINKSQGQSLDICGIDLEYPVFSHGQLYVACSRVGKPSALFIYIINGKTKNIVYHKALA